ncbi:MAG: hypothetical protein K6G88_07985 [Lachnospiraceae bacterium]|nr:hypothetical protein [Lachnospiraceae bacterium]
MGKLFSIIGYLILGFVVLTNYIGIELNNASVIILAIVSAVFMVVGILYKGQKEKKE